MIGVIIPTDPQNSAGLVCSVTAVYGLVCAFVLFYFFREQMRYNPYSYNTIFYFGFVLFSLFVTASHAVLAVRIISDPRTIGAEQIIRSILGSAKSYVIFTSPFVAAFSIALCVSNVSLIIHEGLRPVNLSGIILSVLLAAGDVFIFVSDYYAAGDQTNAMVRDIFINLFSALYLHVECMIIGTIAADAITARYEPGRNIDIMIILGYGLNEDGTPTPLLCARVERAGKVVLPAERRRPRVCRSADASQIETGGDIRRVNDIILSHLG